MRPRPCADWSDSLGHLLGVNVLRVVPEILASGVPQIVTVESLARLGTGYCPTVGESPSKGSQCLVHLYSG